MAVKEHLGLKSDTDRIVVFLLFWKLKQLKAALTKQPEFLLIFHSQSSGTSTVSQSMSDGGKKMAALDSKLVNT